MPSSRWPICIAAFKIVSCHTLRWWCGPQAGPNARHHDYSQILRVFPKNLLTIPAVLCDNRIIEQLPNRKNLWQHRTIPALRPKHRSGGYGTASALPKGLRYPHRASGAKAPRTLRPLPLLRFAVSATGGAHLCSIQYYLRFWLSSCRTSLAVSALRIMRYCLRIMQYCQKNGVCIFCLAFLPKKVELVYVNAIYFVFCAEAALYTVGYTIQKDGCFL